MVSGWEIVGYGLLGLVCAGVAYAFITALRWTEDCGAGRGPWRWSKALGRLRMSQRAAIGGLAVGLLGLASPAVWGTGHEAANLAAAGKVGLLFLISACLRKLA